MNQTMKKGMSLVEVVVAMTLVVLISFAALSAVLFGVNSIENQQYRQYAVNEAENIISCLQSDEPNGALEGAFGLENINIYPTTTNTKTLIFCFPNDYYENEEAEVVVLDDENAAFPSDCIVSVLVRINKSGERISIQEVFADALYIKTGSASLRRAYRCYPDMEIDGGASE